MRPLARPTARPTAQGVHPIAALPPLELDPAHVARVGIVRAALDAVRDDSNVAEMRRAAKAQGHDAHESALSASANLARRSAETHEKRHAKVHRHSTENALGTENATTPRAGSGRTLSEKTT